MDFGQAADDYRLHRKGFPPSLFDRLPLAGRILDLGSGTGSVAQGYAARGASVIALDVSREMLRQAGDPYPKVVARAEACPFGDGVFDAVVAGQCWHWFDGPRVAREATRVVRPGGTVAVASLDYVVAEGNVAAATEALILRFNPGWPLAGGDGRHERWRPDLEGAGLVGVRSWWYDETYEYSHEAWRGRIRACNGVIAMPAPEARAMVDRELALLLAERFAGPLIVPHRIFVISGLRPPGQDRRQGEGGQSAGGP